MSHIITANNEVKRLFIENVKKSLSVASDLSSGFMVGDRIVTSDIIQAHLLLKDDQFFNNIFKPIILTSCIRSENLASGSGEMTLLFSLYLLDYLLPISVYKNHNYIIDMLDSEIESLISKFSTICQRGTKSSIKRLLNERINDNESKEIVRYAMKLSGSSRKIFIEKSLLDNTSISVSEGFTFPYGCDPSLSIKKAWSKSNVKCAVIDGIIENISEIHHLLTEASENGDPYVLFVRGLSDDVRNTLVVNKVRGAIDVMCVEIPVAEATINTLNDVAIACNSDIISSYKGDLISKSTKKGLSVVESIKISERETLITNKPSMERVSIQISALKDKRDTLNNVNMTDHFNSRIKSLSSNRVDIKIGRDQIFKNKTCVEEIDKFFRIVSEISKSGFIDSKEIISKIDRSSPIEEGIYRTIKELNLKIIPISSMRSCIKISKSLASSIISSGCILQSGDQ